MAVYESKTAVMIAEEALNRVGIFSSTAIQRSRAKNNFLRAILADIWTSPGATYNIRLKSLQAKHVEVLTEGLSKFSVPSAFDEEITLTLLDSTHTGTAQIGSASTITLEAGEDVTASEIEGHFILITSGTSVGELKQCSSYNTTTLVATTEDWTATPDSTSKYAIIDSTYELEEETVSDLQGIGEDFIKSRPTNFVKLKESGNEYFVLNCPVDKNTYGVLVRYYVIPIELDETGAMMTTIYSNWYQALIEGTAWKIAVDEDDDRAEKFEKAYFRLKANLLAKEIPFGGDFQGFEI